MNGLEETMKSDKKINRFFKKIKRYEWNERNYYVRQERDVISLGILTH